MKNKIFKIFYYISFLLVLSFVFNFIVLSPSTHIFSQSLYNGNIERLNEIIIDYHNSFIYIASKEERRYSFGYRQGLDTSCGISATATLLRFFFRVDVDEEKLVNQFFDEMEEKGDYTISLLDIKNILEYYKILSVGRQIETIQLYEHERFIPFIVHIEKPQSHFTIFIGTYGEYLLFIDPSEGIVFESKERFEDRFSGYILIPVVKTVEPDFLDEARGYLIDKINHLVSLSGL